MLLASLCACTTHPAQLLAESANQPIVSLAQGKLQGTLLAHPVEAVFKGIPYAQPPVGALRWREPLPAESWSGIRQATEYGAPCAQAIGPWNRDIAEKSSEDCLTLNIWAPEWPVRSSHPVMFWIHGGGNSGGSSLGKAGIEPPFDGAALAAHGVVVVTINYRLGLFGFIGHPALTLESAHHASGNYGLLDQVAALQWVHDNIAAFGGDPGNVTVFGQSAGAQNTSLLLTSPLTKGLMHKVILESGSPMISDKRLLTPLQVEQLGLILGKLLKAPDEDALGYLRALSTSQILAISHDFDAQIRQVGWPLDAAVDGYVVPRFAPEVYRNGQEPGLPMLAGDTGRESEGPKEEIGKSIDMVRPAIKSRIQAAYYRYPDLLQKALLVYGVEENGEQISAYPPYGGISAQFRSDFVQRCQVVTEAAWHSRIAPTYEYEFTGGTAAHPPVHSSDLAFVFGILGDQESDANAVQLSKTMQAYWTNFARTGDPNAPGLPFWPLLKNDSRQYVELSNQGVLLKSNIRQAACSLYSEKLERDLDSRKLQ